MIMSHELKVCKSAGELVKIEEFLQESLKNRSRMDEVERGLFNLFLEWGLQLLKDFVEASGDGDEGETCEKDGQPLRRLKKPHNRPYRSIFGVLEISRPVYGSREGQKIEHAPLDAQLGLPAGEQSYVGVGGSSSTNLSKSAQVTG